MGRASRLSMQRVRGPPLSGLVPRLFSCLECYLLVLVAGLLPILEDFLADPWPLSNHAPTRHGHLMTCTHPSAWIP